MISTHMCTCKKYNLLFAATDTQDVLKKGFGAVTTPLLAVAGVGSARTSVAGEREASPQPATSNPLLQTVRIDTYNCHDIVYTTDLYHEPLIAIFGKLVRTIIYKSNTQCTYFQHH